jgi:hypothetical protein
MKVKTMMMSKNIKLQSIKYTNSYKIGSLIKNMRTTILKSILKKLNQITKWHNVQLVKKNLKAAIGLIVTHFGVE